MEFISVLDYIGVAAFAITGILKGIKHRLDIFGLFVLAAFTALGGGLARDSLLGIVPPKAFLNPWYWWIVGAAVVLVFAINRRNKITPDSLNLNIADAVGLAAFTFMGCEAADAAGCGGIGIIFSGVLTAVGGGVIRDLLVREIPMVLHASVYATAALLGAACFYIIPVFFPEMPGAACAAITFCVVFFVRLLAIFGNWRLPKCPS
jgi:uncharacterized membrane protein YeiH